MSGVAAASFSFVGSDQNFIIVPTRNFEFVVLDLDLLLGRLPTIAKERLLNSRSCDVAG